MESFITMTHDVAFITEVDNVCGEDGKPLAEMDAIVLKRLGDGHRTIGKSWKKNMGKRWLITVTSDLIVT